MGLEVVVSEIMDQGRKRAEAHLAEARREAERLREEAERRAAERAQTILRDAERQAEAIREQGRARAEFEAKKQVLHAEKALWDDLRRHVLENLARMDDAQRKHNLEALVARAKKEIPSGKAIVRKQDAGLVAGYEAVPALSGAGGLIVESADGTVRMDLTCETLLADLWKDVLKQESKALFGKE